MSFPYIYFEMLEGLRRGAYIAFLLSMLAGLPFAVFIVAINLTWFLLIGMIIRRLVHRHGAKPQLGAIPSCLREFFETN